MLHLPLSLLRLPFVPGHVCLRVGKLIVGFSNNFFGLSKRLKSLDEEISVLTNSVNRLKGHPATLAWYLLDEVPVSFLPRITERRRIVHALDGEHPTWCVLCQPYNMEREMDTFDICGNDSYPVCSDRKRDMSRSWLWAWVRGDTPAECDF